MLGVMTVGMVVRVAGVGGLFCLSGDSLLCHGC